MRQLVGYIEKLWLPLDVILVEWLSLVSFSRSMACEFLCIDLCGGGSPIGRSVVDKRRE